MGPNERALNEAIDAANREQITDKGWKARHESLEEVVRSLRTAAGTNIRGETGNSMRAAFTAAADEVEAKKERLFQGVQAMNGADWSFYFAGFDRGQLDTDFPVPASAPTFEVQDDWDQAKIDTERGKHEGAMEDYQAAQDRRERRAKVILDKLNEDLRRNGDSMKEIHGLPDPEVGPSGGSGGGLPRGGGPGAPLNTNPPSNPTHPTVPTHPTHPTHPTVPSIPTDPGNPGNPGNPGTPGTPGTPPPGGPGGDGSEIGGNPGTPGTPVSPGSPGGGGSGFNPGIAGGIGLGAGALATGLGRALGRGGSVGVPGQSTRPSGTRAIGSGGRSGTGGALGRGATPAAGSTARGGAGRGGSAARGGRAGAAGAAGRGKPGAAGGRGAGKTGAAGAGARGQKNGGKGAAGAAGKGGKGGAGAGAARGGRRRDDEKPETTRDLFDDGQDWLDDEGGAHAVLD